MNKVSVVIPAYNAAGTVEKTVRSVMLSTLPIDVLVVDDGSTDDTGKVLDKLEDEYRRDTGSDAAGSVLRVMHQPNQGAYMARLNALKRISTPWFGFADADDTVSPTMFEKMLAFAEREDCDVVQCGAEGIGDEVLGGWYGNVFGEGRDSATDFAVLGNRQEVESRFIGPQLSRGEGSCFVWNKLYRNQYDFSTFATFGRLTNYEDLIFNFQFFDKVRRMGFLRERLYNYAVVDGSATHSFGKRQFEDFLACVRFRQKRGAFNARWLAVNLKNVAVSFVRAKLKGMESVYDFTAIC